MATYKTPGVYVEEISTLPASVAQVETAIPAFIGYTEKATKRGEDLTMKPTRIKSMLDFEAIFGMAPQPKSIEVSLTGDNEVEAVAIEPRFFLYNSMKMFFNNGGGPCYIISVNSYQEADGSYRDIDKDELITGIDKLKKEDEPTLILTPDAPLLGSAQDMADVQAASLAQCNALQDRFSILDVYDGNEERSYDETDVITQFRNKVGSKFLKYGAAYYPWIKTSLSFNFDYEDVVLKKNNASVALASISKDDTDVVKLDKTLADLKTRISELTEANHGPGSDANYAEWFDSFNTNNKAHIKGWAGVIKDLGLEIQTLGTGGAREVTNSELLTVVDDMVKEDSKLHSIVKKLSQYDRGYTDVNGVQNPTALGVAQEDDFGYPLLADKQSVYGGALDNTVAKHVAASASAFRTLFEEALGLLTAIEDEAKQIASTQEDTIIDTNPVYGNIVNKIREEAVILPPSSAMAGIYATVDSNRGVWKAPANISLSSVIGPTVTIDNNDQEDLNVDVVAGKSVNAIRSFIGKGTLVWGARTLAGNDNEWRYVSVRRFYNMVEESVKKATERVVFEPNDANTWIKLKAQIENFLGNLWRQGALAGAVPEQAFFVNIGLGQTMTALDVLEGRMIVEIGMAVVRPAEFIILRFSHKMQES